MNTYTDQLGNPIKLVSVPRRIVSVVPSQSQFLWDIGIRAELVGISKFCIHPDEMFRTVERVGGTKELNLDKIRALKPDLIVGNKEENTKEQIEILRKEFPVWMSDIYTFDDAFHMMDQLGSIAGRAEETIILIGAIRKSLDACKNLFSGQRVAYFIWNRPYMFAGKNTFIDHVGSSRVDLQACKLEYSIVSPK